MTPDHDVPIGAPDRAMGATMGAATGAATGVFDVGGKTGAGTVGVGMEGAATGLPVGDCRRAAKTVRKFASRSGPPSTDPVAHGGFWHPRLTMPETASIKASFCIPPSTKL